MLKKLHIYKDGSFSKAVIFVFIPLSIFIISSCSSNEKEVKQVIFKVELQKEHKKLSVKYLGEVTSGKSYAFLMTPAMTEAEKNKAFKKTEKGNPWLDRPHLKQDSILVSAFEKLGIIKNYEIRLDKFICQNDSIISFIDNLGNKLFLKYYYNTISQHLHFKLSNSMDTIDVDTQSSPTQNLDYAFIDVIPGGNKELVFLDDWHISNNDRFHFKVYQIESIQ